MGKRVTVELFDDLEPKLTADETLAFAFDGVERRALRRCPLWMLNQLQLDSVEQESHLRTVRFSVGVYPLTHGLVGLT